MSPKLERTGLALVPHLFHIVIPRRLGLLESGGRSVKLSLVHVDLWYGNASVKEV